MALTTAQQTQMDELKALIDEFEAVYKDSPSMMNLYGSYLFDLVAKLKSAATDVESA